jgi:hypothetical protein
MSNLPMLNRFGIHERWEKNSQPNKKIKSSFSDLNVAAEADELSFFVKNGFTSDDHTMDQYRENVDPPDRKWEGLIGSHLKVYSSMLIREMEAEAINTKNWPSSLASTVFEIESIRIANSLNTHMLFPARYGGRLLQRIESNFAYSIVIGLMCGQDQRALLLAKMLLRAIAKKQYKPLDTDYVAIFLYKLLANYLQVEFLDIRRSAASLQKGEFVPTPYFDELFPIWRTPDPQDLIPHLLSVCDCHTHHSFTGANSHHREFSNGMWTRIPLIPLLVFKLRKLLDLENPVVDHPLMNTVLGRLPDHPNFQPDALILAVRERMKSDGLDEDFIFQYYDVD